MSTRNTFNNIGDWVLFYRPRPQQCRTPEWARYYSSPCRIMTLFKNVNVFIQQGPTSQALTMHIDNLKKYHGHHRLITQKQMNRTLYSRQISLNLTVIPHQQNTHQYNYRKVNSQPTITTRSNRPVHLPIRLWFEITCYTIVFILILYTVFYSMLCCNHLLKFSITAILTRFSPSWRQLLLRRTNAKAVYKKDGSSTVKWPRNRSEKTADKNNRAATS